MKRHALILTGMLSIAVPSVAVAQAPDASPFSDYRSATLRAYPDNGGGGGGTTTTTATTPPPAPGAGQAPATGSGAPTPAPPAATTATPPADPTPGSGRAPGNGTGNGTDTDPANGAGNAPGDGSGKAPGSASGAPVRVAPSTNTHTQKVKGGLPFTGADVTPIVLLALLLVSGGLFIRVAERRVRGRSAAH